MNGPNILVNCVFVAIATVFGALWAGGLLTAQPTGTKEAPIPCAAEAAFLADLSSLRASVAEQHRLLRQTQPDLPQDQLTAFSSSLFQAEFETGRRMARCLSDNYALNP